MGVEGQSREFNFIQDGLQVDYAAQGIRTPANGLASPALNDKQYDMVIGYSGGTTTVVTAMALQNVKANTLILISPMRGGLDNVGQAYLESMGLGGIVVDEFDWNFDWQGEFEQKIQTILDAGTRIVVIQSEQDELPLGSDFQYRFSEDHDSRITVHDVTLIHEGIDAHSEIFFDHAMNHIKDGMYDPPIVQTFQVTPLSVASGESFTIDYTVSDNSGSSLKQVELWRKDEQSDWQEIDRDEISGDNGPISGSFTDSPSAPSKYWYGLHVVDNAGNWNDEKNSNTNGQPSGLEPVEVEVKVAATARVTSQAPSEEWNRTFGGPYMDAATSVQPTSDGGYIIAGNTVSKDANGAESKDNWQIAWLIKTDSNGNEVLNRTFYNGKTIFDDWYYEKNISDYYFVANSVQQTSDGGYILAGSNAPYHVGHFTTWLIKTDSEGIEIWSQYLGVGSRDQANSVQPTNDGGYILAGSSYGSGWAMGNDAAFLIKTNSTGNEIWSRRFGVGSGHNHGSSVQPTNDGGYILAGNRIYDGVAWLIKTDSEGNELWNKTFGKSRGDEVSSVQLTFDGGYIMAGATRSYSAGWADAWLIKTDSEGNELWNRTFGGSDNDEAVSVQPISDGSYILAGKTYSFGTGGYDAWLIKTDSEGNELWNRTFGGSDSDEANSLQLASDGGYIIAGTTAGNAWLIKIDADGNIVPTGENNPARLKSSVNDAESWFNKGTALRAQGKYDEAIKAYDEAIKQNPQDDKPWSSKGFVLFTLGKYDDAIKAFDEAIRLDPISVDREDLQLKGLALALSGRYNESLEAYDEAIKIEPKNAQLWDELGFVLYGLGKYDEALERINRSIELNQSNGRIWYDKGFVLQSLGRNSESQEAYAKAKEIGLDDAAAMIEKGTFFLISGRYNESIEAFNNAILLEPKFSGAWFAQSLALRALHRDSEANATLSRASALTEHGA